MLTILFEDKQPFQQSYPFNYYVHYKQTKKVDYFKNYSYLQT